MLWTNDTLRSLSVPLHLDLHPSAPYPLAPSISSTQLTCPHAAFPSIARDRDARRNRDKLGGEERYGLINGKDRNPRFFLFSFPYGTHTTCKLHASPYGCRVRASFHPPPPPSEARQGKARQAGKTGSEKRVGTFVPRWVRLYSYCFAYCRVLLYYFLTYCCCTLMLHESLIWTSLSFNNPKKTDRAGKQVYERVRAQKHGKKTAKQKVMLHE